jgi:hypothetical protein
VGVHRVEQTAFGRKVCGVAQAARGDARTPSGLLARMEGAWETGLAYAR